MTDFKKHRGRHRWAQDDTGIISCVKCGKQKLGMTERQVETKD